MRPSYERVDYSLRPAKAIVRKMTVETVRRLAPFGAVKNYRYVGLGSTHFSDFIPFHRALGIENMLSIEREEGDEPRFKFNRPFSCIRVAIGESTIVLSGLTWEARTVLWLDYDDPLNQTALADIQHFCSQCRQGSILLITMNARSLVTDDQLRKGEGGMGLERLADAITSDKVPIGLKPEDLQGWKTSDVYRDIIDNHIRQTVEARNGGIDPGAKIRYKQLANFHYADGAKMMMIGGIFYDEGQEETLAACGFEQLDFVRHSREPCRIEVPVLTHKERRHLDSQLPGDGVTRIDGPGIPTEDVEKYRKIYRFFPSFVEAEF